MTGFDVFIVLALLGSAAAGWFRGGLREITALFSFLLAGFVGLITLPWTAPIGRNLVNPDWAGSILPVGVVFVLVYFGIRWISASLSSGFRGHALGALNQAIGLVIGVVRALVLIGAAHLTLMGVMSDNPPEWLTKATLLPISQGSARAIQTVLPILGRGADAVTPIVKSSVREGFSDQ